MLLDRQERHPLKMMIAKDIPYKEARVGDPSLSRLDIFYPQIVKYACQGFVMR